MFLVFCLGYSEWIYPVLRIIAKNVYGNLILRLELRNVLELNREVDALEGQLVLKRLVF